MKNARGRKSHQAFFVLPKIRLSREILFIVFDGSITQDSAASVNRTGAGEA